MPGKTQYSVNGDEFVIRDYNNSKAFASFLPAVAGLWGKPLWVYYVNRGQAVSNFGVQDKDGAMLEFIAANKAWRLTASQGFRTFYKINGTFYEPFCNIPRSVRDQQTDKITQTMYIKAHSVRLVDRNEEAGVETEVTICTLPGENFPALLRRLTVRNISSEALKIECIDGLPMLIPFGTRNDMLKNMSRLAEGWFAGVIFSPGGVPYYKLPVEAVDRPEVIPLTGTHFYCGRIMNSAPLYCIDPDTIFGEQRDYCFPDLFLKSGSPFTVSGNLSGKNKTPSAMGYFSFNLPTVAEIEYYSMVGHCTDYRNVDDAAALLSQNGLFESKEKENEDLIKNIASCLYTESAYPHFDTYCSQNFIDNVLRGGFPVTIGKNIVYYAYSRVHGDMEREYNNFVILSEYFSQGNGNYRDVNQNRRNDVFFNQTVGDDNLHFFMNLLQTDGFNPLRVLGVCFIFKSELNKQKFMDDFSRYAKNLSEHTDFAGKLSAYINVPLTIGGLFNFIDDNKIVISDKSALLVSLLENTKKTGLAEHGEGYWSDHWHYNIDLIENYLAIFPDRFEELLLGRKDYVFFDDCYFVEPRSVKYVLFRGKPRQTRSVRRDPKKAALIGSRKNQPNTVRSDFGTGNIYYTNLLAKCLCLIANKYASLDPDCLGLEMESDKPNWCDALNGLPGLFGSSSAETLELLRLISLLNKCLAGFADDTVVPVAQEVSSLLKELADITQKTSDDNFRFWDLTHTVKENFREKTRMGLSGVDENITIVFVRELLFTFEKKLGESREELEQIAENGIVPTYFAFIPEAYIENKIDEEKNILLTINSFKRKTLPLFLEGTVHYLRLRPNRQTAENFHCNMLASPLYDKKLQMFKINAPIAAAGQDIGRITVFTPGWLENESIWLHMEYKYLLELIRNGMAAEFYRIAKTALVPFFDPAIYGRSIFENVSFIVSSAHPEEAVHGQGFVARLSGATAEFISIWVAMTSGLTPFSMRDGKLCLAMNPLIPADFFTDTGTFSFNFLGTCRVIYHNESRKDTFGPQGVSVCSYRITYDDCSTEEINGSFVSGTAALAIREGKVVKMEINLGS